MAFSRMIFRLFYLFYCQIEALAQNGLFFGWCYIVNFLNISDQTFALYSLSRGRPVNPFKVKRSTLIKKLSICNAYILIKIDRWQGLETKGMRLIFEKNNQKNVLKLWEKFENILNKDRILLAIIACNKLLKKFLNG